MVHPTAPRCLEQGWLKENANRPPTRNTRATGDRTAHVVDVLEDDAARRRRRGVRKRQLGGLLHALLRTATAFDGHAELVARRVDPDDVRTVSGEHWLICPSPHPTSRTIVAVPSSSSASGRLFDVLGVGALGEPLDPPIGVLLPHSSRDGSSQA